MKKILIYSIGIVILMSFLKVNSSSNLSECEVRRFYEAITPDYSVKVLTSLGEFVEPELILAPTNIDIGDYQVDITRKASNMYKIEGTKLYVETNLCYEFVYFENVFLKVENYNGYTFGTIYFD
jgi:hypothetical protein